MHLEPRVRRRTPATEPGLSELRDTHERVRETFVSVLHMLSMATVIYALRDANGTPRLAGRPAAVGLAVLAA